MAGHAAYVNGRLATAATLAELGARTVDLHGQHAHQSLLSTAAQRDALDRFCSTDLEPLRAARARLTEIDASLAALGGDQRSRAREVDLLRFQVGELAAAAITDADEDDATDRRGRRAWPTPLRIERPAKLALDALIGSWRRRAATAAADRIGAADPRPSTGRPPFEDFTVRLHALAAELTDVGPRSARVHRDASTRIHSGSPRSASGASCCATCVASTATRWPMSSAFSRRREERLAELESYDQRVAALEQRTGRLRSPPSAQRRRRSPTVRRAGASRLGGRGSRRRAIVGDAARRDGDHRRQ